jgi:hypothetical protein
MEPNSRHDTHSPDYEQRILELRQRVVRVEDAPTEGVFHLGRGEVAAKERDVRCSSCNLYIGMVFVKYDIDHVQPIGRRFVLGVELKNHAVHLIGKSAIRCPGCEEIVSLAKE